jgi:hypothetical protein
MMRYNGMKHAIFVIAAAAASSACARSTVTSTAVTPQGVTPGASVSRPASDKGTDNGQMLSQPSSLPPEQPAGDPRNYFGDPELYGLLNHAPWTPEAAAALAAYEERKGTIFLDLIGEVAEDSSASIAARANALKTIEDRKAFRQIFAVENALHAKDPRVRAIALSTAWSFWIAENKDGLKLVRDALDDPAPEIQAKVIQLIGDEDLALIRDFAQRPTIAPSVRPLVTGMIRTAEENGAALVPLDSATGVLQRTSTTGFTMRYTPRQKWGSWGASIGTVEVRDPKGKVIPINATLEVVGNVVPLFFSSDGKYIVYEADRHIHVRNVANGADRDVGVGIAPRLRPFTDQFIYLAEDSAGRVDMRDKVKMRYEVRALPLSVATTATTPVPAWTTLGALGAFVSFGQHGSYSPVRWMRLEEHAGSFYLRAEGIEAFTMPSPFGAGGGS